MAKTKQIPQSQGVIELPSPKMDTEEALFWQRKRSDLKRKRIYQLEVDARFKKDYAEIDGNRFEIKDKCPCGLHRGVQYFIDTQPIGGILCPVHVYLVQLRDAVRHQCAGEFIKFSPFEKWMEVCSANP